jgi:tetratricopeptide (TPR) repeat protein
MDDAAAIRTAVTGLLSFAAAEEQMLLAAATADAAGPAGPGRPRRWAAAPLVAHNTEFKSQQVQRLNAIRDGQVPPTFAEIDHDSAGVYQRYASQPAGAVAAASSRVTQELTAALNGTTDADLLDPGRHPWLAGRLLWLQVVVRGFWHPAGHLGEYYLARGRPDRAVALAAQAVAWSAYLDAPAPAQGMARYNLACAQARSGRAGEALAALTDAIALNADLRANAFRDADLGPLRDSGELDALLR